ncbi:MAG: hypothetical protein WCP34_11000 [Pseudomonadota bacterium]
MPKGGFRPGAGRKRGVPTVVVRIPEGLCPLVESLAEDHRERLRIAEERVGHPHILLSQALRLAELSERLWKDEGDGVWLDQFPLDATPRDIESSLTKWGHAEHVTEILQARREWLPLATLARRLLNKTCPMADDAIRENIYCANGWGLSTYFALRYLHAWGLILDDFPDIHSATGSVVADWLLEQGNNPREYHIPHALEQGRVDIAKALGLGLYHGTPRDVAIVWYRRQLPTGKVEEWAAHPGASEFCYAIHTLIPEVTKLPKVAGGIGEFLKKISWNVTPAFRIQGQHTEPDSTLLRAWRGWYLQAVEAAGEVTLLRILEELFGHHRQVVEHWLEAASALALDWREVLELPTGKPVTLAKARIAYKRLASRHHPDKGGDTDRMKQINRAWEQAQAELG